MLHVDLVLRAAGLLRTARHAVALTGAGLSTRSGIPDFRSPGTGLWEKSDPMEVASISAFHRNPERFYSWIRPLGEGLGAAQPNDGHRALADLESAGYLRAIITQNVDGLHQRAGSKDVVELHGDLREATCVACGLVVPGEDLFRKFLATGDVPRCPACASVMKPNVVLIGELLPMGVVSASLSHLYRADVLLVAGSSLEMAPASKLPRVVHEHGGRLIVVNLTPTYADALAEVVIHDDVVDVLPMIARACVSG